MNGDIAHSEPEPPSLPRKVTIDRAAEGYGFNLHGEKGIHGQFISAIDDGSPAQKNDLRVGDRVIAVNNEDVEELPHSKVVERIRAGGNSVTLLVVDEQCDQYYKNLGVKIPQDKFETPNETAAEVEENHVSDVVEESEMPAENNERETMENTTPAPVVVEAPPAVLEEEPPRVEEEPEIPEEPAKEIEDTTDGDEYDEVIPQATSEIKPAEVPTETPPETTTPEPLTTTTTSETNAVVSSSNGPSSETSDTSFKMDMAAARPKPKRHEVKRATQNWKQKYDDFNKL